MNEALAQVPAPRRIAVYQRVSSETQRERETIKTQAESLERAIATRPDIAVVRTYIDDGVSGTVAFVLRPQGAELLADASKAMFEEVWVYRFDRIARDEIDGLVVRRDLAERGVQLYSIMEGEASRFVYGMHMLVAADNREKQLKLMAEGTDRAAREGRYCGGIVPYGYRVKGHKQTARLVPAEDLLPGCLMSESEVIRHIYSRLGVDGWSCRQIATELNDLGIPTKYTIEGRGLRGKNVQGRWGAGRIRNMVVNPVYRGELRYGRRATKSREVIKATVPALVDEDLWLAAQDTLTRNRVCAKNTERVYLLRGVIRCGVCGRTFCGSLHRGGPWYRCDGTLRRAELTGERCPAKMLRGDVLEDIVWNDIECFLRNPGEVLRKLEAEVEADPVREALAKERARWEKARQEWEARRERLLELFEAGHRTKAEMEERLIPIVASLAQTIDRLAALNEQERDLAPVPVSADLLEEIRGQLDTGLSDEKRAEIVRLLVRRITVFTDVAPDGKKTQRVFVEYLFPRVSLTGTVNPASLNCTARIYRRVIVLPSGRQKKARQP
jgi:site-specific DNA recombinase